MSQYFGACLFALSSVVFVAIGAVEDSKSPCVSLSRCKLVVVIAQLYSIPTPRGVMSWAGYNRNDANE
jgi:hypothetical protein